MSFTLSTFKQAVGLGSRPNNFKVTIASPIGLTLPTFTGIADATAWSLLCKSAAVPGFSIGVVEVPVQGGRRMKLPGDRTFAEWTATFIADEKLAVRSFFENWIANIATNDFQRVSKVGLTTSNITSDYKQNIQVQQLDAKGTNVIKGLYVLKEAFPTDISAIDLSYDTTDTISEFSVTFQYSYVSYTTV
jgi:hypothetical protein